MSKDLEIIFKQTDSLASKLIELSPSEEFYSLLDIFDSQFNQLMQIVEDMNYSIPIDITGLKGKIKIIEEKLSVEMVRIKDERDQAVLKKSYIGAYGLGKISKSTKIDSVS